MVITLDFIILTLFLMLNLLALIIKEKNLVFPSIILSFFTIIISIYYALGLGYGEADFTIDIEFLYCTFISILAIITIYVKGSEKY